MQAFELSGLVELIIPEVDPVEMMALFNNFDMNNPSYVARLQAYKTRVGYNVTDETIYNPVDGTTTHYVKGNTMTLNIPGGVQVGSSINNAPQIVFTFDDETTKTVDLNHYHGLCIKPNTVHVQGLNMDNYPG